MKHTEEEIEKIAKSMYKAVKKALSAGYQDNTKIKADFKSKKDAIADLEDPNYIAEAKESTPPRRTSNMTKGQKGVNNVTTNNVTDKKTPKRGRSWAGDHIRAGSKLGARAHAKRVLREQKEMNKPNLPKSEKGVDKLKKFKKNIDVKKKCK